MRLGITGMEPNPSGVEAGLSQAPGESLHENVGSCGTRDTAETNSSSPLRAAWVPSLGLSPIPLMQETSLGMSDKGKFSERGQEGVAGEGVLITEFSRVC